MYAGMDAWILTQLFDSILMTSEIGMKSDMKSVVRTVSREYHVTLPVPLNHFRVSTDIPDEIAMAEAKTQNKIDGKMVKNIEKKEKRKQKDENNEDNSNHNNSDNAKKDDNECDSNNGSGSVIMQKSLPLKAMVFKEINMSKKWNVPNMYKWTDS